MADPKTTPGASDVEITIGDETVILRATLDAALTISRAGAGIYGEGSLHERLVRFDLDAYTLVIRAGLGLTGNAVKNLDERIFRAGVVNLTKPLTTYVIGLTDPEKLKKPDSEEDGGSPLSLAQAQAKAEESS